MAEPARVERPVATVVVIWEPTVLTGARTTGHFCAGTQDLAAQRHRAKRHPGVRTYRRAKGAPWKRNASHRQVMADRPDSAMGIGQPVATPWEKCGKCPGLGEHVMVGYRLVDVPASELDARRWPIEPGELGMRDTRGERPHRRPSWMFTRPPKVVYPRTPWWKVASDRATARRLAGGRHILQEISG